MKLESMDELTLITYIGIISIIIFGFIYGIK